MQKEFWLALAMSPGIGNVTMKKIYTAYPQLTEQTLQQAAHITKKLPPSEQFTQQLQQAKSSIALHNEVGIKLVTIACEAYPKQLRPIPDPPAVLYVKGNINLLKTDMLAIIGTRTPTNPARQATSYLTRQFILRGYTIVSGLALGIDTVAHETTLAENGQTIAVLAGSLDKIYPAENTELAEKILASGGLLVSEVPMQRKLARGHFVARDRIQSGLSLGVCPIQGAPSSGTLHAVKAGITSGRVLCYPKQDNFETHTPIEQLIQRAMAETRLAHAIELRKYEDLEITHQKMEQLKGILL